jgi:hypothetical protein
MEKTDVIAGVYNCIGEIQMFIRKAEILFAKSISLFVKK